MDLRKMRNDMLSDKVLRNLEKRGFEAFYVQTREEALAKALELIPEGSVVSWGGSASIAEIGLQDSIRHGNYQVIDRDTAKSPEERTQLMRQALLSEWFLGSTNAMTEDGVLINIDGNGNRLAAYNFGPEHVLLIVGMNKVVKNEEEAILRARNVAAPINIHRFPLEPPCKKVGSCVNCLCPDTICAQILTTRMSRTPGRMKMILVNEDLGY